MKYLLDTNARIEFLRRPDSPVKRKLLQVSLEDVVLCSVVKAELYYGAQKSAHVERNATLMREFFASFESLPFDDDAAESYGNVRAHLEKRGETIGPNDLMIAAIALAHGSTLVTHNKDEFRRIPDLVVEDWQT
ncbi:MAG: type II toxin-antitoxin system VapC family toxin [Anaerolineales bacterium]